MENSFERSKRIFKEQQLNQNRLKTQVLDQYLLKNHNEVILGMSGAGEHNQISRLKVLHEAEGHYIGRERFDQDMNTWNPHNRLTDHFKDQATAEAQLPRFEKIEKNLKELSIDTLSTMKVNNLEKLMDLDESDPDYCDIDAKINLIDEAINEKTKSRKEEPDHEIEIEFN